MVEQEQAHRIKYESDLLGATIKDTRRGHWMGSAISFAAIGAAAYGIYMGVHPTAIIALVSLPIFAIIKAIVGNKSNSN